MIREATRFDIPEIIDIGRELYNAAPTHNFLYNWNDKRALVAAESYIKDPDKLLLIDIEKGFIKGFFVAHLGQPLATTEIIAVDVMMYIRPEYQGSFTVIKFIKYYEKWAKDNGAKHIQLSVSSGLKQDRTLSIYSYMGYKPECVTYVKGV